MKVNTLVKYKDGYKFLFAIPGLYTVLLFHNRDLRRDKVTSSALDYFGATLALLAYLLSRQTTGEVVKR